MTRARDLANIADGTFTATDLDLSGTLSVSGDATFDTNTLFVDVSTDRVGVGTTSPAGKLDVTGEIRTNDDVRFTSGARHKFIGGGSGNNLELGTYSSFDTVRNIGLVIDSASNVGIGTTSPASSLDISNAVNPKIFLRDTGASVIAYISGKDLLNIGTQTNHDLKFATNDAERMRIDSSGNVGIGTSSPVSRLEVRSGTINVGTTNRLTISADGTQSLDFYNHWTSATGVRARIESDGDGISNQYGTLKFYTTQNNNVGVTERMRISSAGNVGIGTTSPASLLHIKSSSADNRIQLTNSSSADDTTGSGASIQLNGDNLFINNNESGGNIVFRGDSFTELARIDSTGNVGIGTSSPAAVLHADDSGTIPALSTSTVFVTSRAASVTASLIAGNTSSSVLAFGDSDDEDVGTIRYDHSSNSMRLLTNGSEAMRIDSSGNVGIGTSSPKYSLDVQGTTYSNTLVGRCKTISGGLPATGIASGDYTWTFDFQFDDTYGTAIITLDISAGLAQTAFGRYTFAVECSAGSGSQTVVPGTITTVFEHDLSSFTVASSGTTDRKFTVAVTRTGTENWASNSSSFSASITQGLRECNLISVTAS